MKSKSQAFKLAIFCLRGKVEAKDVGDAEADPMRARLRSAESDPGNQREQVDVEVGMDADGEDADCTFGAGISESESGQKPVATPVPDAPPLSAQLPSPHGSLGQHSDLESSFDKICEPSQSPRADRTQYDEMTSDQPHDKCPQQGFRLKESKAALKTRLTTWGAAEEKRNLGASALQDTPVCNRGSRERAPGKRVMGSDITTHSSGETPVGGNRERAPAWGVKVSDIPAGFSGKHSMDGEREREPARGVKVSDIPAGISAGILWIGDAGGRPRMG